MRIFALVALSAGIAWPGFAADPPVTHVVTVAQLEQAIAGAGVRHLVDLRLGERLSERQLSELDRKLGHEERDELLALADESAFLDPPASEFPSDPGPGQADQERLLALATTYARNKMTRWSGFYATRTVTRFEGTAIVIAGGLQDDMWSPYGLTRLRSPAAHNWECPGRPRMGHRRLEVIERASGTVIYRVGHAVHAADSSGGEFECTQGGVTPGDEFEEIAQLTPIVTSPKWATWSHWERSETGLVAVFRYEASVAYQGPKYENGKTKPIDIHGEIALNPSDGAIVRFTEVRRWMEGQFEKEYDTAVEFGPVTMGQATVLRPIRRVSMFMAPILRPRDWGKDAEGTYRKFKLERSPMQEYLIDVRFGDYRPYDPTELRSELHPAASTQ